MNVLKYLENNTLQSLSEKFGIIITNYEDRVVLNYHMINSHGYRFHPIVKECKGLILGKNPWKIMARSFDRFYNYGEDPNAEKFSIGDAICYEKIDGSLISVYHDGKKWCAATRKRAFAEGPTSKLNRTFLDVFEEAIGGQIDKVFNDYATWLTYVFEVVSPETRIVTWYDKPTAYLISIRNKINGQDHTNMIGKFPFKQPKQYKFSTNDQILEAVKNLKQQEEGYVCHISRLNWRIKVKNPKFLALAHLRENGVVSTKKICYLVATGEYKEYLSYFPEDQIIFDPFIKAFNNLNKEIENLWHKTKGIRDQKEFALRVKDALIASALFALRQNQIIDYTKLLERYFFNEKILL